jgi:N-acetyl sugar amidotransferase
VFESLFDPPFLPCGAVSHRPPVTSRRGRRRREHTTHSEEENAMITPTSTCTRCIMDTTAQGIRFDDKGVCNYCHLHDRMEESLRHKEGTIEQIAAKIRKAGKNRQYDCVVGVSGGTDSTYCLYMVKKLGLRPLAVHFDNGWVSDVAVRNIKAMSELLKVEVRRVTADWDALRAGYRACIEASTPDVCMPCEIGVYSALYAAAEEAGVRYIIVGLSYKTEGINPLSWHYCDARYFCDVLGKHGPGDGPAYKFNRLKLPSFARFVFWKGIRTIQLPLYVRDYKDKAIQEKLSKELGWVYGGRHHFDCTYKPLVAHIHTNKFDADLRKVSLSAQIRTGEITREAGLASLRDHADATEAELECALGRLGMTKDDLDRNLKTPPRTFRDYRSYFSIISRMKLPLRIASRLGIFPETTYEKMFKT